MQFSDDVKRMVFPLTLVWLALTASMLIYAVLLIYMSNQSSINMQQSEIFSSMKSILIPLSYAPFILTVIFYKKLNSIVRKKDMDKVPYAKALNDEDKKLLSYFGSYFIVHIILWCFNEAGAILGFVLAVTSGVFSYYAYPAVIAIFLNLVLMRPKYFEFIKGKRFE